MCRVPVSCLIKILAKYVKTARVVDLVEANLNHNVNIRKKTYKKSIPQKMNIFVGDPILPQT